MGYIVVRVDTDILYDTGMVQYANTAKSGRTRIGTELSADVRWRVNQHLVLGAIVAESISGPVISGALGNNVMFFVLFVNYRFLETPS